MNHRNPTPSFISKFPAIWFAFFFAALLAGCSSTQPAKTATKIPPPATAHTVATNGAPAHSDTLKLREGDILKLTFPGAANLNTAVIVRRDGKITPPLIPEIQAAGLTPDELKKKLVELYKPQLLTDEVTVTVESSTFSVFVTGAVIKPGEILSDHPLTALEAIMKAGGFDYTRANLKGVKVTRMSDSGAESFKLNLKAVLDGTSAAVFYVKPNDIIFVPEKFSWF